MSSKFRSDMDTAREFVRVWQQASSAQEVAEHFKTTLATVSSAATAMRRNGVDLKKMAGRRQKMDYAALARIAEEVKPTTDDGMDEGLNKELAALAKQM